MRAQGNHIQRVRAALAERLLSAGFVQRRKAALLFCKPLTTEVVTWVGLTTRTQKTNAAEVGVRATMGVRHEPLMRLYAMVLPSLELKHAATIVRGLEDILGNEPHEWIFEEGQDPTHVAEDMVSTILRAGVPWSALHVEPTAMRDAVLCRLAFGVTHSTEQILPLLDVFCGESASAVVRLRASLQARGTRADIEAREFQEFAQNMLRHLGATQHG